MDFDDFFRLATGERPYGYQRELGETERPPSVLEVHTGAGKAHALIVSWLYIIRVRVFWRDERNRVDRRIFAITGVSERPLRAASWLPRR